MQLPNVNTQSATPAVHAAVSAVTRALSGEGIAKTRHNRDQNFSFRGIDDILNELSPLLVQNSLVVLPRFSGREVVQRTSAKGSTIFNVTLQAMFTIRSLIDGSELECGPFIGEAMDFADKATNKAMSACYKYFALLTFCIPLTGSDFTDGDAAAPPVVATVEDVKRMKEAADAKSEEEEASRRMRSITLAATLDELHVAYLTAYKAALPTERIALMKAKDKRKQELSPKPKDVEDVPAGDPKATPPSRRGRKPTDAGGEQ